MAKIIELISYVKRAKNRQNVLLAIDHLTMPSDIVRKLFGKWSSSRYVIVSRALAELTEKGLVKVENPNAKIGRLYSLTILGKMIVQKPKKEKI